MNKNSVKISPEQADRILWEIAYKKGMTLMQASVACGFNPQYFSRLQHMETMSKNAATRIKSVLGIEIYDENKPAKANDRLPVDRDRLVFELRKRGYYLASASQALEHARDFLSVQFTQNDGFIPKRDIDRLNKRLGILYADIKPLEHNPLTAVSSDKCVRDMTIKELYEIICEAVRDAMKEVSK